MSEETKINLYGTVVDSIVDGPGLRLAIFFQGCPHHCPGCHNPESQLFIDNEFMSVNEVLDKITPLTRGITVSGGEPFAQPESLLSLVRAARDRGVRDIWVWTGYLYENLASSKTVALGAEILSEIDVLVDGPYIEDLHTNDLQWVGSSNQRIIDVKQSIAQNKIIEAMHTNPNAPEAQDSQ